MNGSLAIVAYRSLVTGAASGKIDFQVRWFDSNDNDEIRATIIAESSHQYSNPEGEKISWELVEILAIERFEPNESGQEVIGFITSIESLSEFHK